MRRYVEYLFDGIPMEGRAFVDVGGGVGIFCAVARALGARRAVCLEPGAAGANAGIKSVAGSGGAPTEYGEGTEFIPTTLEQYVAIHREGVPKFDVIQLHNVINHLDEDACIALHRDHGARAVYRQKIAVLSAMAAPGATLILCDCARSNFFPAIGLPNPLMRSIEWHKHQNPETWSALFGECGWKTVSTAWTTPNSWGRPGRLLGNRIMSYFLLGHFRLELVKQ